MANTEAGVAAMAALYKAVTIYLAVGTGTTAFDEDQTTLISEVTDSGLARALATKSYESGTHANDTVLSTYTWTASGSKTLGEYGVFDAASSGNMYSRRVLSPTRPMVSGDTYTLNQRQKFTN